MATSVLSTASTLLFELPDGIALPPYRDKVRTRKSIIRSIVKCLQSPKIDLLYVGYKPDYVQELISDQQPAQHQTFVSINVLEDNGITCSFASSENMIRRRFRKELQLNDEWIIIDNEQEFDGFIRRKIDIYVKYHHAGKHNVAPAHTLAVSSAYMAAS